MTKKVKRILIFLIIVVLIGSSIRIYSLNAQYPSPIIEAFHENQSFTFYGCEFSLQNAHIYDDKQFMEHFNVNTIADYNQRNERKILVFKLQVKRIDMELSQYMNLSFLAAESSAWTNGVDPSIFELINMNPAAIEQIELGKECLYYIPLELFDVQFSKSSWKNLIGREFSLIFSMYPVKTIITGTTT